MENAWYDQFTSGAPETWRKGPSPAQSRQELEYLTTALACDPGARVLDVPCGSGRHLVELASMSYKVAGLDTTEGSLRRAVENARSAGLKVDLFRADVRNLPWQSEFDGAFCLGGNFGYLDYNGMVAFLSALARTLKTGARFVLETAMVAECVLPNFTPRSWLEVEDTTVLIESHYEASESRLDTRYTFIHDGERQERTTTHWVYSAAEIKRLFARSGMEVLETYGSPDRQPFELGSPRMLMVTAKKVDQRRPAHLRPLRTEG